MAGGGVGRKGCYHLRKHNIGISKHRNLKLQLDTTHIFVTHIVETCAFSGTDFLHFNAKNRNCTSFHGYHTAACRF